MNVVTADRGFVDAGPEREPTELDAQVLAEEIATSWGLSHADMLGPLRTRPRPAARAELYRRLHAAPFGWSYCRIARFVGRSHPTILNAVNPELRAKKAAYGKLRWAAR